MEKHCPLPTLSLKLRDSEFFTGPGPDKAWLIFLTKVRIALHSPCESGHPRAHSHTSPVCSLGQAALLLLLVCK